MLEITTILVIVNIAISALSPIIKMIGRIRHSECVGVKMDMDPPSDRDRSNENITKDSTGK